MDISTSRVVSSYLPANASVISPHSASSMVSLQGRGDMPSPSVNVKKFTEDQCCCQPAVVSSAVQAAFEDQVFERIQAAIELFGGEGDHSWRIENGTLRRWLVAKMVHPPDISGFKSLGNDVVESLDGDSSFPCKALISFGASLLNSSVDWFSLRPELTSILIVVFGFYFTVVSVIFLWLVRDFLRYRSSSSRCNM